MKRHQHAMVKFLSHLGQVWVYASYKPELLTTSMMVSVGNAPTLGAKQYPLPLISFKLFSRVNVEKQECFVIFCDFSGFVWTFLCINWVFNAFMCIIQIWTTYAHAPVHINWLKKIKSVSLGACLGPMQEMVMNFKHRAPLIAGKTLRCLVSEF